jgi:phospholipase C
MGYISNGCGRLFLLAAFAAVGGCAGSASVPSGGRTATAAQQSFVARTTQSPIQHVIIIIQENQSFDHLFHGFAGADYANSGLTHTGQRVTLAPVDLGQNLGLSHTAAAFLAAYDNGKMDGFDLNPANRQPTLTPYTYIPQKQVQPYFDMAAQYVLADHFHTSHIDASFAAHQYLIAAQAGRSVNLPTAYWGCSSDPNDVITTLNDDRTIGPPEAPCFDYPTVGDLLDAKGLTWRYYAPHYDSAGGLWLGYLAVNHIINGPDKKYLIEPETRVLTDIPAGKLANVTWIVPSFRNSDHDGSNARGGPSWVTAIVNAVGQSKFWDSSAIFVTWDEWGGTYDHVPPAQLDYDGLGFRVPLLCISPYAKRGAVLHKAYEAAGIVKFVEGTFGLTTLAAADARAADVGRGCLDFTQSPRTFTPFAAPRGRSYLLTQPEDSRPSDDR